MPFLGESSILFGGFTGPTAGYVPAGAILLDGSADYLQWTPSGAGDSRTTWTLSCWAKLAKPGAAQALFSTNTGGGVEDIYRLDNGSAKADMQVGGGGTGRLTTTQVLRDPTAWSNHVIVWDSGNSDFRYYIDGVEVSAFDTQTLPSASALSKWNGTDGHYIGRYGPSASQFFNGYLTDVIFLDGTASTDCSEFGEYDTNNNWIPKDPSGLTFGTNGFWLDFANSADLGNDVSGNGNDFTPTSMSAANSTSDRPADDAENDLGNYNTVSTLFTREVNSYSSPAGSITTSNGNLTVDFQTGGTNPLCITTQVLQPGKKYHFEWTTDVWGSDAITYVAVWLFPEKALKNTTDINAAGVYHYGIYTWNPSRGVGSSTNFNGSSLTSISASDAWGVGEVLSLDIDMSTVGSTTVVAKLDGVTLATDSSLAFLDEPYVICPQVQSNGANRTWKGTFNFGASAFATTPLTDHVGVYTSILPAPTVIDPSDHFTPVLYVGDATNGRAVSIGETWTPGLVWIKDRTTGGASNRNVLYDQVRGSNGTLYSDGTEAEAFSSLVSAVGAGTFTVNNTSQTNGSGDNYIAWCWKAGTTFNGTSNRSKAYVTNYNATAGFSIITYTGSSSSGYQTLNHKLGVAPKMVIIKNRGRAGTNWPVYHTSCDIAANKAVFLNTTAAQAVDSTLFNATFESTNIYVNTSNDTNLENDTYVAYCWAEVEGFSKFGSYTGNGSADGPFVYCGFRPAFLLVKNINNGTSSWGIWDSVRNPYNLVDRLLFPNLTNDDNTPSTTNTYDFTANGFKVRSTGANNGSGQTIIYAAFAEFPFGGEGISQARAR